MSKSCVTCLKIGDLSSHEYVNNLYKAVRKYTNIDFICFTDNSEGIVDDVITYDIESHWDVKGWWPAWSKLEMYGRDELKQYDKKIFFDLDIVIQNNITPILEYETDWAIIDTSLWKGEKFKKKHPEQATWNSSCTIYKDLTNVYESYIADSHNYVTMFRGCDNFMWVKGFKPDYLPRWFYSYREGWDPSHYWENRVNAALNIWRPRFKYNPDFLICLFHQKPDVHELDHENILYKIWNDSL